MEFDSPGIFIRCGFKKMNKYACAAEVGFGGHCDCWQRWNSHLHLGEFGQCDSRRQLEGKEVTLSDGA